MIRFKQAFEIRPEERTRFVADFAPFRRGNGEYLVRPVASGTQALYGEEATDASGGPDGDGSDGADADEPDEDGSDGAGVSENGTAQPED